MWSGRGPRPLAITIRSRERYSRTTFRARLPRERAATDSSKTVRDCRLIDAKARFFGDNLAMVHGSESAVRKEKDGTEKTSMPDMDRYLV